MQLDEKELAEADMFVRLSIPFVGFLRMQREHTGRIYSSTTIRLSIPFVGFLRMQPGNIRNYVMLEGLILSIPFVGFLRMQHEPVHVFIDYRNELRPLSIPFVEFLRMQPSLIRLSFLELGG